MCSYANMQYLFGFTRPWSCSDLDLPTMVIFTCLFMRTWTEYLACQSPERCAIEENLGHKTHKLNVRDLIIVNCEAA